MKLEKKKSSGIWSRFFGGKSSKQVDDNLIAQLVDMGYDVKKAKKALEKANNELEAALDILNKEEILGIE